MGRVSFFVDGFNIYHALHTNSYYHKYKWLDLRKKQIGVIIPIGRRAEELKGVTDFHRKLKEKHLRICQFADELDNGKGETVKCPISWH